MAINDTDLMLVNDGTSTEKITIAQVRDQTVLNDSDKFLVNDGSKTETVTWSELKDELGPSAQAPSVDGAVLTKSGSGSGFSGNTFTTTLTNYNPGVPAATQTMKARVVGSLQMIGETSAITNVNTSITPIYSNFLTTSTTWSGSYTPDRAFDGIMHGDGGCATDGTADCKYTHPEIITVTKLEMRSYSGLDLTLPDGSTTTCPGIAAEEGWSEVSIPNGSFDFDGTNFILMKYPSGTTYFDGIRLNGAELIDSQSRTDLTLTDRKDLDNGLFVVGDTVTDGVITEDGTGPFIGFRTIAGMTKVYQEGVDYTIKSGDNFEGASNKVLCFDTQQLGDNWTFTLTKTAGAENFQTYTADTDIQSWQEVFNNVTSPITIASGDSDYSRYIAIYATGTGYMEYELTGTGRSQNSATLRAIEPVDPKITVSGGSWSAGETVKNTVARAPEITPTTDEITGFSQVDSWNMAQIWRSNLTSSTGGFQSAAGNAFDGNVSNRASTNSSGTDVKLTFAPDPGISFTSKLEVYCDQGSDVPTAEWDGNVVNPGGGQWVTVYEGSGTIDDTKPLVIDTKDAVQLATLNAVRVDGQILVDSDFGTPSPKNTVLTFASDKDLPNFDGGDEVAQDSGHTPRTSAITDVTAGTPPATPYSDDLEMSTGSFESGYPATQAFDGDTSTYARSGTKGAVMRFQPNGGMAYTSKVEAYFFASGGNVNVQMNSGGYSGNYAPGQWHEIATGSGNIGILYMQPTAGSAYIGLVGLKVDGVLLLDNPGPTLTLTDDTDLANFRVNDRCTGAVSGTNPIVFVANPGGTDAGDLDSSSDRYAGKAFDGGTGSIGRMAGANLLTPITYSSKVECMPAGNIDGVRLNAGRPDEVSKTFVGEVNGIWQTIVEGSGTIHTFNATLGLGATFIYAWRVDGQIVIATGVTPNKITAIGPGNTLTVDGGTWNNGDTVTGPACTAATGTVGSTDSSAKTMTLSASDESGTKRWIVNQNKKVVGPTGPANKSTAYLTWNGSAVTGIVSADPGYAAAPTDLKLTFTDNAPTGQTWDQELPAGTTIATRVYVSNDAGSDDTDWSTALTPRFLREGDDLGAAFAEEALRMATFENRAAVHQGELAMAKREALRQQMVAAGASPPAIDKLLGGTSS